MLSRVANSIYWMARYVERAESIARFVAVARSSSLENSETGIEQWEPLVRATGDEDYYSEHYEDFAAHRVRQFLTFDKNYHSSIQTSVARARENARSVREAISSEAWEQLNRLHHFIREATQTPDCLATVEFYEQIVQRIYHFNGIIDATMTRDAAWHFANVGRMLERADKTSRILDVKYFTLLRNLSDVNTTIDDLLWSSVLRSASAFEMYRKRYHSLTVERIVEFLILERKFPRAIRYSVRQARNSLAEAAAPVPEVQNEALMKADHLVAELDAADTRSIIDNGVHEFIDSVQRSLNGIADAIQDTYFAMKAFAMIESQQQS